MKKSDMLISVFVILLLIGIIAYPAIISNESSGSVELAIENHKDIQLIQTEDFPFAFSIKNQKNQPVTILYEFLKDDITIEFKEITLESFEKKTFSYNILLEDKRKAHKYTVEIFPFNQKIGFYTLPNSTYLRELESGPDYDRGIPWDYQDPLIQEYYRRG